MRAADVPAATELIESREPWRSSGYADVLDHVTPGSEHRALVCERDTEITGVAIYRMVAGAAGTAEIECVVAGTQSDERMLVRETAARLLSAGARLIVAEYPTTHAEFSRRLRECGFTVTAVAHDLIADGVGLEIAVLEPADLVTSG